jgi:saccharopine dehydrogenase (NAD+, L-lysine forming)
MGMVRVAELVAAGVLGPEAFEPTPFLDLLKDYGSPWGLEERG